MKAVINIPGLQCNLYMPLVYTVRWLSHDHHTIASFTILLLSCKLLQQRSVKSMLKLSLFRFDGRHYDNVDSYVMDMLSVVQQLVDVRLITINPD